MFKKKNKNDSCNLGPHGLPETVFFLARGLVILNVVHCFLDPSQSVVHEGVFLPERPEDKRSLRN